MRALLWTAPMEASYVDYPEPSVSPGYEIIDVEYCGVCGSDLHGYRGHSPVRTPPLILGHEVVGRDSRGRRVIVNPLVGCGECRLCNQGLPNLCPRRGLLGLDRPGGFAERVAVPTVNLVPVPDGLDPLVAALTEPLATPLGALRQRQVEDAVVLIAGCGPIGLLAAYAARQLGARFVCAFDRDPRRIEMANAIVDYAATDAQEASRQAREASGGLGADIAIDAVGVEASMRTTIESARPGGEVILIGLAASEATVPVGAVVRGGINVTGVYAYTPDDFRAAVAMLGDGAPPREWTATEPLANGSEVLEKLAIGEDARVKVVFRAD